MSFSSSRREILSTPAANPTAERAVLFSYIRDARLSYLPPANKLS